MGVVTAGLNMDIRALWELCAFYQLNRQNDLLGKTVQIILDSTDDPEEQACCYHWLGECAEMRGEYDSALEYYSKGRELNAKDQIAVYFLHNNAGYCLNVKGQHKDAEAMCRKAIEIDSARHNAWKNLGLSLEGQGDAVGAAWAYIAARNRNSDDNRAAELLKKLSERYQLPVEISVLLKATLSKGNPKNKATSH
jgi:tetratricopeptide (TPR) repeat protein